jgi:hypothetical protein
LDAGYYTRDVTDWHLAIFKEISGYSSGESSHLLDLICLKACLEETLCNMFVYDGVNKVCYIGQREMIEIANNTVLTQPIVNAIVHVKLSDKGEFMPTLG